MTLRHRGLLAAAAAVACLPTGSQAQTLSLVGSSGKVCQLTGERDWATNALTDAQTETRFGLVAVDLGFPVDSGTGSLYFLFGDARPPGHLAPDTVPPDDALGITKRKAAPDSETCPRSRAGVCVVDIFRIPPLRRRYNRDHSTYRRAVFFLDDYLYGFFWTNHCVLPTLLTPNLTEPLALPGASRTCPETPSNNSLGNSVLARAPQADPASFIQTAPHEPVALEVPMPNGFVYVSAAAPAPETANEPKLEREGIAVFGAPRFRASVPYLALAPRATFGNPSTWSFYAGRVGGNPVWIDFQKWEQNFPGGQWKPPAHAEIFDAGSNAERCIGEHSVTWNAPLQSWLLLYGCGAMVEARSAPKLWGPWSKPVVLLNSNSASVQCSLIMKPGGCPGRTNYWPLPNHAIWPGPFLRAVRDEPLHAECDGHGTRQAGDYLLARIELEPVSGQRDAIDDRVEED